MLTFPVLVDKDCIGVTMVLNKIGADSFTAEDEKVGNVSLMAAGGGANAKKSDNWCLKLPPFLKRSSQPLHCCKV